jgi:hypothetical protein
VHSIKGKVPVADYLSGGIAPPFFTSAASEDIFQPSFWKDCLQKISSDNGLT